jgi:CHAP domain
MTLDDFVLTHNRTKIDEDNYAGFQCTDVFRKYCRVVLEIPHTGAVIGARDLYLDYLKMPLERKYFDRIPYTGDNKPVKGDVLVWEGSPGNKYGHVAICLEAKKYTLKVFEQDGFKQDGAKITERPYKRLLGWLSFKDTGIRKAYPLA